MQNSLKVFCSLIVVIALPLCTMTILERVLASQDDDRMIELRRAAPNQPIEIVEIKNSKQLLKDGSTFHDDHEWLKGLTLKVTNKSHKKIKLISVELLFPRSSGQLDPPVADSIEFGTEQFGANPSHENATQQLLLPEESCNVSLTNKQYAEIRELLKVQGYGQEIRRVILTVEDVVFDDGTKWHAGLFLRRDPTNPQRWIKVGNVKRSVPNHHARSRKVLSTVPNSIYSDRTRAERSWLFLYTWCSRSSSTTM